MFKIGQKVVCIKADEYGLLKKDEIYTVSDINFRGSIMVAEVDSRGYLSGYFVKEKFRPIDDDWAKEILERINLEIKEEELVLFDTNEQ